MRDADDKKVEKAAGLIAEANHVVAFTGAGVSAESGVPTYRGDGGLWEEYDPEKTATLSAFKDDPDKFWSFIRDMAVSKDISPNPAHKVLADWEKEGILKAVITQNIDLLHEEAGNKRVLKLHGSLEEAACRECGEEYEWNEISRVLEKGEIPRCRSCDSRRIKPEVVFFGEMLPRDTLKEAEREARKCDLMLVIGSSLAVHPAASLPAMALRGGADLIYVNADRGERPGLFDVILQGSAGEILPELASAEARKKSD